LWLAQGQYPDWGTTPEWDEVLRAKQTLADCERYHCRPSELDDEDWHEVMIHRAIESAERQYLDTDRKFKAQRPRKRR